MNKDVFSALEDEELKETIIEFYKKIEISNLHETLNTLNRILLEPQLNKENIINYNTEVADKFLDVINDKVFLSPSAVSSYLEGMMISKGLEVNKIILLILFRHLLKNSAMK